MWHKLKAIIIIIIIIDLSFVLHCFYVGFIYIPLSNYQDTKPIICSDLKLMQSCHVWINVWKDWQSCRHNANEGVKEEMCASEVLEVTV